MSSKTAQATIKAMMSVFSRHGIPDTVIADNMPFNSVEFHKFAKEWDFTITTSSPNYLQSNGLVERNVQMIKQLFSKVKESNTSIDLTLLEYRNTPFFGMDLSPAQLLMSRRLRSNLPMTKSLLSPQINENAKDNLQIRQQKQEQYYNRGARPLPPLPQGDVVRLPCIWQTEWVLVLCITYCICSVYVCTPYGKVVILAAILIFLISKHFRVSKITKLNTCMTFMSQAWVYYHTHFTFMLPI